MVSTPTHMLERWPLGWTVAATDTDKEGISLSALSEILTLFKSTKLEIDSGICHHLGQSGRPATILCLVTKNTQEPHAQKSSPSGEN